MLHHISNTNQNQVLKSWQEALKMMDAEIKRFTKELSPSSY